MVLLVVLLVCFTQGEILHANFKKMKDIKHVHDHHLSLSCGFRCLVESKCRSFVITKSMKQCEIFNDICRGKEENICYQRITDELAVHDEEKRENPNNNPSRQGTSEEVLLMLPPNMNLTPKVYNFQSHTITDYPGQWFGTIRCIIHMPLSKQLLFAALLSDRVQTYWKGEIRKTIARFKACSLAVDEDTNLVFMVKCGTAELYRKKLDNSDTMLIIFNSPDLELNDMVSNVKEKQLYVLCFKGISVVSYNGRILNTLEKTNFIRSLTLSAENDMLYYCDKQSFKRFILGDNQLEKLLEHEFSSCNMAYHKGSLFVSTEGRDQLCEIILNSTEPSCTPLGKIYDEEHFLLAVVVTI